MIKDIINFLLVISLSILSMYNFIYSIFVLFNTLNCSFLPYVVLACICIHLSEEISREDVFNNDLSI